MAESKTSVFDYTDYRRFLADYYKEQKSSKTGFSYRYFSQRAKINSTGLYKDVIDGKRGLGKALILKFSTAIGLKKMASQYFENLVFFNEADSLEDKQFYFKRMMECYQSKAFKVGAKQHEFFSKWYYVAIREVLAYSNFDGDFKKLANELDPPIQPAQAEKAVKLLESLGMIFKDEKGNYLREQPVLTTGEDVDSLNVSLFQKSMLELSGEATERHHWENRDMSTLTVSVNKDAFKMIQDEITAFRKKVLNIAEKSHTPDRVYQINMQYFPLSNLKK